MVRAAALIRGLWDLDEQMRDLNRNDSCLRMPDPDGVVRIHARRSNATNEIDEDGVRQDVYAENVEILKNRGIDGALHL